MPYKDKERQRSYLHQHYINNRDRYAESRKITKRSIWNEVKRIKEENPCTDCGEFYPYFVMDFDHKGNKIDGVNKLLRSKQSRMIVLAEISKCDLVCANCHRYRTASRKD